MRVFLLSLVFVISGCSTPQKAPNTPISVPIETPETALLDVAVSNDSSEVDNLSEVAADLVSALTLLREFPPLFTTIQFSEPDFRFGNHIVEALRDAGYGLQKVSEDQGTHYIEIERSSLTVSGSSSNTIQYSITVADIKLSRGFEMTPNRFDPMTPLFIQGIPPRPIGERPNPYPSLGPLDRDLNAFEFRDSLGNFITRVNPGVIQKEISESQNYLPYKQLLVRFKPNSLDIGLDNKAAIKYLINDHSPEDRLTISACHHENSSLWDGDSSKALEREKRVTHELLILGIAPETINTEGCLSTNYNSQLEKSSVVLTLESLARNPIRRSGRSGDGRARYGFF